MRLINGLAIKLSALYQLVKTTITIRESDF